MRVAFLADASNIHSIRWVNGLAARGLDVHLISVHELACGLDERVTFHALASRAPVGYIASALSLRRLLIRIKPHLTNVHYATGYGLLARLARVKPILLSVWGSDVYEFPNKSRLHRWLLRGNLRYPTAVASTSRCMATETAKTFKAKNVFLTPFGIDENAFSPSVKIENRNALVIGTVKTLSHKYGIDTLIQAFARVCSLTDEPVALEISGGGPDMARLQALAEDLGVASKVTFFGRVDHKQVPAMLGRLDVYVALSRLESFGVAILEASAMELPVVVSDADGPVEVTVPEKTGFIVPRDDPESAAAALLKLVRSHETRDRMGRLGRSHVIDNYSWSRSVDIMIGAYRETVALHK